MGKRPRQIEHHSGHRFGRRLELGYPNAGNQTAPDRDDTAPDLILDALQIDDEPGRVLEEEVPGPQNAVRQERDADLPGRSDADLNLFEQMRDLPL